MARVTAETVKEIITTSLSDEVIDSNHIETAHIFVDEYLASEDLSVNMLEKIELYLAAHFVALSEEGGPLTRDKLGDADTSFANIFGGGLNSTRFGQNALALDVTGTLSRLSTTKLKADFRVV